VLRVSCPAASPPLASPRLAHTRCRLPRRTRLTLTHPLLSPSCTSPPAPQYNIKQKLGRGFTLDELREAKINSKLAVTIGISVDHRRTNKSEESFQKNVDRLKDFKARLVVFPKRNGAKYTKKGDASAAQVKEAVQLAAPLNVVPKLAASAISVAPITEEMKNYKAFFSLREARNEARLYGIRIKRAKEAAKEAENK